MNEKISALIEKIKVLEDDLENEIEKDVAVLREQLQYQIEKNRVLFEEKAAAAHKKLRVNVLRFITEANILHIATAPVIYSLIVPLVMLDIFVAVYQAVCFPVYGIKKVPRADFIAIDRRHLNYLNFFEKLNCEYCGYASGILALTREVAARTEKYWCPIKHAKRIRAPHDNYYDFLEYGDAEGYRNKEKEEEK